MGGGQRLGVCPFREHVAGLSPARETRPVNQPAVAENCPADPGADGQYQKVIDIFRLALPARSASSRKLASFSTVTGKPVSLQASLSFRTGRRAANGPTISNKTGMRLTCSADGDPLKPGMGRYPVQHLRKNGVTVAVPDGGLIRLQ